MENNKWNNKVHRLLSLWLNQIATNRLDHHNTAFKFIRINRKLLISAIIVSAIAGSGSFINFGTFGTNVQKVITVIVGFFAVANVILTSIISEMKLEQKSEQHRHIATEYAHISTLIQTNMVAAKKPDIDLFLKSILDKITAKSQSDSFRNYLLRALSSLSIFSNGHARYVVSIFQREFSRYCQYNIDPLFYTQSDRSYHLHKALVSPYPFI